MNFRFVSFVAVPVVLGVTAFLPSVAAARLPPAANLCAVAEARPAKFVKRADFMDAVSAMASVCPEVVLMLLDQPTLTIPALDGSGGDVSSEPGIDDSAALAALRAAIADMITTNTNVAAARATLAELQPSLFSRTKADPAEIEAAKAALNSLLEDQFYAWSNAEQVLKDVAAVRTAAVAAESNRLNQKIAEGEDEAAAADEAMSSQVEQTVTDLSIVASEDAPVDGTETPASEETAAEETPAEPSVTTEVVTEEPAT